MQKIVMNAGKIEKVKYYFGELYCSNRVTNAPMNFVSRT